VSVPRQEKTARVCESEMQQHRTVPAGIATSPVVAENRQGPAAREAEFSTDVRSVLRNTLRRRCVSCVSSAVALRKRAPELRIRQLRTPQLRTVALSAVASAYPQASPKDTLVRVFDRMKRAARADKFRRMSGRLALQPQRLEKSASQFAYPQSAYPEHVRTELDRSASSAAAGLQSALRRTRHDA
jgi:hypothetical protein